MDYVELVRKLIMDNGYLSETQIRLRLGKKGLPNKEISKVLNLIRSDEITRIKYTNSYVSGLKDKYLFYYNPGKRKKK